MRSNGDKPISPNDTRRDRSNSAPELLAIIGSSWDEFAPCPSEPSKIFFRWPMIGRREGCTDAFHHSRSIRCSHLLRRIRSRRTQSDRSHSVPHGTRRDANRGRRLRKVEEVRPMSPRERVSSRRAVLINLIHYGQPYLVSEASPPLPFQTLVGPGCTGPLVGNTGQLDSGNRRWLRTAYSKDALLESTSRRIDAIEVRGCGSL